MKAVIKLIGFAATGLVACTPTAPPVDAYEGYTGAYDGFTLVVDDRFDSLDPKLWRPGDGAVGGESICRFQDQGVVVKDGVLNLVVRPEYIAPSFSKDHDQDKGKYEFVCGEVRTQDGVQFRYGRIEARMKAPNRATASGYISSLFTYRFDKDAASAAPESVEWEEIDVELEGGRPDKFQANLIYGKDTWEWWRTRQYGAWEDKIEIAPVDEWRVFAIEWVPDAIRWYVDGELVKTLLAADIDCDPKCIPPQDKPAPIPNNPATIIMNFWIPNDIIEDNFGGNKQRNVYPMTTQYDWFRYYEYDAAPNVVK